MHRIGVRAALVGALVISCSREKVTPAGTWSEQPALASSWSFFTSAPLEDGSVLLVGGGAAPACSTGGDYYIGNPGSTPVIAPPSPSPVEEGTSPSDLYDAASGVFTPIAAVPGLRDNHSTATRLSDGSVLVVGGHSLTAARYDPATQTWTGAGETTALRVKPAAVPLATGEVLVVGGLDDPMYSQPNGLDLQDTEIYDPATGVWSLGARLAAPRQWPAIAPLPGGRALVVGGAQGYMTPLAETEIYDPDARQFVPGPPMRTARWLHTATALPDGRVLVVGGEAAYPELLASAEIFDPASGTWTAAGNLRAPRAMHAAIALADGRVLVVGGMGKIFDSSGSGDWPKPPELRTDAELYDPDTGRWEYAGSFSGTGLPTGAVALPDGRALVMGSCGDRATVIYTPDPR